MPDADSSAFLTEHHGAQLVLVLLGHEIKAAFQRFRDGANLCQHSYAQGVNVFSFEKQLKIKVRPCGYARHAH